MYNIYIEEYLIYSKRNLTIMADTRLLVVLFPLLAAASWALFNIGRVALQQLKRMS
jgi:hypothetical protein